MQFTHYAKSSRHTLLCGFDDWDNCQGYFLRTNADDWLQGAKCGTQSVDMRPLQTCLDNGFSVQSAIISDSHTRLVLYMPVFILGVRTGNRCSASFWLFMSTPISVAYLTTD